MTTVYGVTMYGAVQQIKRQLKALGMDGEEVLKEGNTVESKSIDWRQLNSPRIWPNTRSHLSVMHSLPQCEYRDWEINQ